MTLHYQPMDPQPPKDTTFDRMDGQTAWFVREKSGVGLLPPHAPGDRVPVDEYFWHRDYDSVIVYDNGYFRVGNGELMDGNDPEGPIWEPHNSGQMSSWGFVRGRVSRTLTVRSIRPVQAKYVTEEEARRLGFKRVFAGPGHFGITERSQLCLAVGGPDVWLWIFESEAPDER